MAQRTGRAALCLAITTGLSGAASAAAQAPQVRITEPHSGIVPGPTVWLEAEVSPPAVQTATLVANGASYEVPVEQGRVRQRIVAVPGNNRVGVVVEHRGRTARDSITFRYKGEPMELVVLLTWPSRGEIIDLWVREPTGETCKWDHRRTDGGGRLLDFSENAIGFGSQAYVRSEVRAGTFRVKVHYWGAYAHDDRRGEWTYTRLMERLDQLDRRLHAADASVRTRLEGERRRVLAQLDEWASPAAPQTSVHAEVVLFPGTRAERRWRFNVLVHRTGQLATIGEVEITDEMIRAARTEER